MSSTYNVLPPSTSNLIKVIFSLEMRRQLYCYHALHPKHERMDGTPSLPRLIRSTPITNSMISWSGNNCGSKRKIWRSVAGQPRFMSWIFLVENWNVGKSPILRKKHWCRKEFWTHCRFHQRAAYWPFFIPLNWGFSRRFKTVKASTAKIFFQWQQLFAS